MNDLQRSLLVSMRDVLDRFGDGAIELGVLVTTLRGLYEAAEFQEGDVRDGFEMVWVHLDHENELRTEGWAQPGESTGETLSNALEKMRQWIESVSIS